MTETQSKWLDDHTWKARWETIKPLGGGGQGEVYRAKRKSDGQIGFLKIIKSKNDPERRRRFYREATAYDTFGVEGIPKLIESNAHRHADGTFTPYIVTEFIEGKTLRAWRESQPSVSLKTAVTITSGLLGILQACHAQVCVHRDVKPDNIILEGDAPERVWLLDFGMSYHDLAGSDFQTEHWQEVGNRFLRLPELSAGSLSKQDPRSDICFAAGILFYLLTGDHPDILEDSNGRLPHQRSAATAKLQHAASTRLTLLLALFDEAFGTRMTDRFTTVQAMRERMDRMMQYQPVGSSTDEKLAAIRETLDTSASRRLGQKIAMFNEAIGKVRQVFDHVQQLIGGNLSIGQTGWVATSERGQNTLLWSRQGSVDTILSVTYEFVPAGEELLLRISGQTVYRTDLSEPVYGAQFQGAVETWLADRLSAVLSDPHALPPEADIFREIRPFASLEAASVEAARSNRQILAFVYDPTQPERGKLRWALDNFLQNRRTRDIMNGAFVTALVPLATIATVSDILNLQSMEESRWVVLDQSLIPLEQKVIYANAQEAESIISGLASRFPAGPGPAA